MTIDSKIGRVAKNRDSPVTLCKIALKHDDYDFSDLRMSLNSIVTRPCRIYCKHLLERLQNAPSLRSHPQKLENLQFREFLFRGFVPSPRGRCPGHDDYSWPGFVRIDPALVLSAIGARHYRGLDFCL